MNTDKILKVQSRKKLNEILFIALGVSGIIGGLYYYVVNTPHCYEDSLGIGSGSYHCDILATNHQKQQICAYDAQVGIIMTGGKVTPEFAKQLWNWCDPTK